MCGRCRLLWCSILQDGFNNFQLSKHIFPGGPVVVPCRWPSAWPFLSHILSTFLCWEYGDPTINPTICGRRTKELEKALGLQGQPGSKQIILDPGHSVISGHWNDPPRHGSLLGAHLACRFSVFELLSQWPTGCVVASFTQPHIFIVVYLYCIDLPSSSRGLNQTHFSGVPELAS